MISETNFAVAVYSIRYSNFRDLEECNSLDESVENLDRNSLTSFGSGNTTDSDKVSFSTGVFLGYLVNIITNVPLLCKHIGYAV